MSSDESEKLAEGTLISHLLELRDRLLKAIVAVILGAIPCLYFADTLFTFAAQPLIDRLPKGTSLIATGVFSTFMTPFKLSLFAGLFVAMPIVIYQLWAFVAPGLYRHEKRFAVPMLLSAVVLFYVGVAFAYFLVFPVIFEFFVNATPKGVAMSPDIAQYLSFMMTMFLSFGVAFEVPVVVMLLVITGIVSIDKLKAARGYVLVGMFIVAAILTPPDPLSQTIMAVPMYLLFEGGLLMSRMLIRNRANAEAEETEAEA
jgi:sec-independent protein translocase protein TatC